MKKANCDKDIEAIENETSTKCEREFREGYFGYDGNHILGKGHDNAGNKIIKHEWTIEDDICVAPIWNIIQHNHTLMSMNLFQNCHGILCNGTTPCIR